MKIHSEVHKTQMLRKPNKFVESMNDRLLQTAVSQILTDNGIREMKAFSLLVK